MIYPEIIPVLAILVAFGIWLSGHMKRSMRRELGADKIGEIECGQCGHIDLPDVDRNMRYCCANCASTTWESIGHKRRATTPHLHRRDS